MFWKSIPGRNEQRESRALFALSLAIASTFLSWSPAFGEAATQFIQAGKFQQQRIQAATREISGRLDALIEKFRSNRVEGNDLQTVLDLRSAVDRLAAQDMQRIIVLLQDVERTNDAGSTRDSLAAVVAAQKEVVDQLRALLSNYRGSQIQEHVSTFRGATERLRQIRQQVAGALKQMGQASTIEQSQTRRPLHDAPPPSSNGNDSASVDPLKGAAGTLADASAGVDKLAAAVVSGASLRGTLQQAHQQLKAAAMHALDNDCVQAQANAIAAQQSLTQAQDALGQMTNTLQSSEEETSALSLNTVVDGQTGDAIEKFAPGDRGWTTWVTGRLPGSIDRDTSFVAAHQGDRIVVMQPPPERVSTQYEPLVEQYFKNLSDESVGTKSSTGGTP